MDFYFIFNYPYCLRVYQIFYSSGRLVSLLNSSDRFHLSRISYH